jgi:hypothetical protein
MRNRELGMRIEELGCNLYDIVPGWCGRGFFYTILEQKDLPAMA